MKNNKKAVQTKNIIIRCSPEQHEAISHIAKASDITITKLILKRVFNEQIKTEYDNNVIERLMEINSNLSRTGNLFKLCIDQHEITNENFYKTLKELREVSADLKKVLEKIIK